jgi:uncharacterized DUF497 family protein
MAKFIYEEWIDEFLSLATFVFNWDLGNTSKSFEKHGISTSDTESAFYDEKLVVLGVQVSPQSPEERYGILATTDSGILLFVSFTLRVGFIRVISARQANKKERAIYES